MFSPRALDRVKVIDKKIDFIQAIVYEYGSVSKALEDEQNARTSIMMDPTSIVEQFDKLLHNGVEILAYFEKQDIKGSYDLRNFIAHDYEGVGLYIVEDVITQRLPIIKKSVKNIFSY
ncbi:MAG: HepT-like ribonuclease domain-containing protein [Sulfurimonas sp.]